VAKAFGAQKITGVSRRWQLLKKEYKGVFGVFIEAEELINRSLECAMEARQVLIAAQLRNTILRLL
jgi:hypothetical protein